MSNLSDIGFPTPNDEAINNMIMHVLEVARPEQCERGFYIVYSDASGAEIYLQGNFQQELLGFNPHYAGKSRRKAGLTKAIERDSSELDGGFEAWANPTDNDGEILGEYPFVFDTPNFRAIKNIQYQRIAEIQLTAFASNDFKLFDSEEAYANSQDSDRKLATKAFIPSGMFTPDEKMTKIDPPRPIGIFTGEIKEYELKTNQLSGESFYWLLVETYGGDVDVVADPKLISSEPKIGGIVRGQFWLSGKVVD